MTELVSWTYTDRDNKRYTVNVIQDVYDVYIEVIDIETGYSARADLDILSQYIAPLIKALKGIKK